MNQANKTLKRMLPLLAMFLIAPALAEDSVQAGAIAVAAPAEAPAAPAEPSPPPVATQPGVAASASRVMLPAMPYYLPYYPAMAGRFLVPVPLPAMPGMPAPIAWVPVIMVPGPAMPASSAPKTDGVDYGPVADTPVVELPAAEEAPAQPIEEPRTSVDPGSAPQAASEATTIQVQGAPMSADAAHAMPYAAPFPTWSEPAVDYGPVTETPVVDMLALEKPFSAPPVQSKKRSSAKMLSTAKPAASRKNRMCWDNGIVAPCK